MDNFNNINIIDFGVNDIYQQNPIVTRIEELSQQSVVAGLFQELSEIKQEVQTLLQGRELSPVDMEAILQATRVCHRNLGQCEKDLTIIVEGKELQVNSFMLACLSPKFSALVAASKYAEEPSEEPISLSDISYAQMERISAFLHGEALPAPITLAEVEALLQLAELSKQQEMPSILKACDAAFCEMLQLPEAALSVAKGWNLLRGAKAKIQKIPLSTELRNRKDLLLRLFSLPGLEKTQQILGGMAIQKMPPMPFPCVFDASQRTFFDKVLLEERSTESPQTLDPELLARRWGQKTDDQKRAELDNCEQLAAYLVGQRADLDDNWHWMLEQDFQKDLTKRSLNLFSFFLYIVSSPNQEYRTLLPPILRALQRSYLNGDLGEEDAEWVLRIAGRDQTLLQILEEEKVYFALPDSEVTPGDFCKSFDETVGRLSNELELADLPEIDEDSDDETFEQHVATLSLEQQILLLQSLLIKAKTLEDKRLLACFQGLKTSCEALSEEAAPWQKALVTWCNQFAVATIDDEGGEINLKTMRIYPIIACSRFICMARSTMLHRMLEGRFVEADKGKIPDEAIVLRDISVEKLQAAQEWMRTESVSLEGLTVEQVGHLLASVDYFGCRHFQKRFENYLIGQADQADNMLILLQIARERDMPHLLRASVKTLSKQYAGIIRINILSDGRLKIIELDHAKVAAHPELQGILHELRGQWKEATLKYWAEQPPLPPRTWRKALFDQISKDRAIRIARGTGLTLFGAIGATSAYLYRDTTRSGLSMMKDVAVLAASTAFSYVPYGSVAYERLAGAIGSIDINSVFSVTRATASTALERVVYFMTGSNGLLYQQTIAAIETAGGYTGEALNAVISVIPTMSRVVDTSAVGITLLSATVLGAGVGAACCRRAAQKIRPVVLKNLVPPPQPFVVDPHELAQMVVPADNPSLGLLPHALPVQLPALRLDTTACRALTNEEICRLVTSYPQLTELTLDGECPLVDGQGWKYLAKLHKLQRLAVTLKLSEHHTEAPFASLDVSELRPSWPDFEAVDVRLERTGYAWRAFKPTARELLFLSNCPVGLQVRLTLAGRFKIKPIAEACPSMTALWSTGMTDNFTSLFTDDVVALAKHCPGLVRLRAECRFGPDQDLSKLAKGCQRLTSLDLRRCQGLTHVGMERLVYYCKELQEVHLKDAGGVNDAEVGLLATLPKLRVIELIDSQVTDEGVNRLLNRGDLPPLDGISMLACPQISLEMQRRLSAHVFRMQSSHIEADKRKTKEWAEILTPWNEQDKEVQRKVQSQARQMLLLGLEAVVQNHWFLFRAPPVPRLLAEHGPLMALRQQLAQAFEIPEEGTIHLDSSMLACGLLNDEFQTNVMSIGDTVNAQFKETYLGDKISAESFAGLFFRVVGILAHFASLADSRHILPILESYLTLSESALSMDDLAQVTDDCKKHIIRWLDDECRQKVSDTLLVQWTRLNVQQPAAWFVQLLAGFTPVDLLALTQALFRCRDVVANACREKNLSPPDRMRLLIGVTILTLAETIPSTFVSVVNQLRETH